MIQILGDSNVFAPYLGNRTSWDNLYERQRDLAWNSKLDRYKNHSIRPTETEIRSDLVVNQDISPLIVFFDDYVEKTTIARISKILPGDPSRDNSGDNLYASSGDSLLLRAASSRRWFWDVWHTLIGHWYNGLPFQARFLSLHETSFGPVTWKSVVLRHSVWNEKILSVRFYLE